MPPRVGLSVSGDVQDYGLVQGDWWTVYGQSCGQVDSHGDWGGAHDWVPCSHARFLKLEGGDWINNTTFCVGSDSVCTVCIREGLKNSCSVSKWIFPSSGWMGYR